MSTSFEPKSQAPTQRAPQQESQSAKVLPSRTIVHAKLEMTEPSDHDEREADAVASAIMSGGKISRKISSGASGSSGIAVSQQMESQLSHLQGNGRQMPQSLRNMMESGFGRDFSQVRLHTDSEAASMSSSIHAKAFTHGNDIYFNRGQFSPETSEGQRLVAHELTHVVQAVGKVARETNGEGRRDYLGEVMSHFSNKREGYSRGNLPELMEGLSKYEFEWLLFAHTEFFRIIAQNDPDLLSELYEKRLSSFQRLRFSDRKKLDYIVEEEGLWFPNYRLFGPHYGTQLSILGSDLDRDLIMTDEDRKDLETRKYHQIREEFINLVKEKRDEEAIDLMDMLTDYDFYELLVNSEDVKAFLSRLYRDEFEYLFQVRSEVIIHLYNHNQKAFYRHFNDSDCESLNRIIARPKGRYPFLSRSMYLLLLERDRLHEYCSRLSKLLSGQVEDERKRTYYEKEVIRCLGNETILELKDLSKILHYIGMDLTAVSAKRSLEENEVLVAKSKAMLHSVEARLKMYVQNIKNGEAQKALIDYVIKTLTISAVSAGVGSAVGLVYTGGVVFNVVLSGTTGTVIEIISETASDEDYSGETIGMAAGSGVGGGAVSELAHLVIPGPMGRFFADVLIGATASWVGDHILDNDPSWMPDEIHDDKLDMALYAYYMYKVGGIDYDESQGVYFVKKEIPHERDYTGKSKDNQHALVKKLNELVQRIPKEE